jgi:ribonuclease HII
MICGIDEAGRGSVIGPLVIAGVNFENDSKLIKYNIRDSKKISPKRREKLNAIINEISTDYELIIISASDIDNLREVMTINEIEENVFSKIIEKLKPDISYIDAADVNEKRFGDNIFSKISVKTKIISKHKADEIYPIVGAASILAKFRRDLEIIKISKELEKKLNLPLGSGYPSDPKTIKFLKNWLEKYNEFPPHIRKSWKTSQELLKKNKIKKLDDFY